MGVRLRGAKFYCRSELFSVDQIFKWGQTSKNELFSGNYFRTKQTHLFGSVMLSQVAIFTIFELDNFFIRIRLNYCFRP